MPIGGLLMMLMMSPTCERRETLRRCWSLCLESIISCCSCCCCTAYSSSVHNRCSVLPWVWGNLCHTGSERSLCGPELCRRTLPDRSRPPPASDCLSDQNRWTHWSHRLNTQTQHGYGSFLNTLFSWSPNSFVVDHHGKLRSGLCADCADTHSRSSVRCRGSLRSCLSLQSLSQLEPHSPSLPLGLCLCHRPGRKKKWKDSHFIEHRGKWNRPKSADSCKVHVKAKVNKETKRESFS